MLAESWYFLREKCECEVQDFIDDVVCFRGDKVHGIGTHRSIHEFARSREVDNYAKLFDSRHNG